MSGLRCGDFAGAWPLPAGATGRSGGWRAGGDRFDGTAVRLRGGRLCAAHVRRAGARADRTACPVQPAVTGSVDGDRGAAGRAGARLAAALGMTAGRDTLLNLLRAVPEPQPGTIDVVGIDDFAFDRSLTDGRQSRRRAPGGAQLVDISAKSRTSLSSGL